jgi:16S rRNA (cytosine967-C5)-methyltransferase
VIAPKRPAGAREAALRVLIDVFGPQLRGAQAAFDYRAREAGLDERDRGFAAELAYGSIKLRRALDWYLKPYVGDRAKPLPPTIGEVLRLGIYQVRYLDGVDPHAAVYETVELAKRHGHKGTAGLVNAVLRRFIADAPPEPARDGFESEADWIGVRLSFPTWIVALVQAQFGDRAEAICAALNRAPQHALRVNRAKVTIPEAIAALEAECAASAHVSPFVAESLIVRSAASDDPAGRWVLQSEASAMPVDLLDPQPGEVVFDLCSGRGNKSVQIAARLGGLGSLVSVERDARKIAAARAAAMAAGVEPAFVQGDVEAFAPPRQAAAVLLDAPCSGIGTLGRHAEARWRKTAGDGKRLAGDQTVLLRRASECVAPGGRLVYAVCSFDPCEGAAVIDAFLAGNETFQRAPLPARYAPFERAGDVVVPPGLDGRDGFFIASLRKRT